eukprot:800275-Amphidinium_carterae.2
MAAEEPFVDVDVAELAAQGDGQGDAVESAASPEEQRWTAAEWREWQRQNWHRDSWHGPDAERRWQDQLMTAVSAKSAPRETADPPAWAGWQHYRTWRRALRRWNDLTDVVMSKRSHRVLQRLEWDLQAKFDHVGEDVLRSDQYLDALLQVLDSLSGEREEDELRRSLQGALLIWKREKSESLTQFVLR